MRFPPKNWKRSPDEVRWLMGFNRDVIHRRRDQLDAMGVRIRWAGRRPKLWKSVIKELESAEKQSTDNTVSPSSSASITAVGQRSLTRCVILPG